jgi:hypothetical protein
VARLTWPDASGTVTDKKSKNGDGTVDIDIDIDIEDDAWSVLVNAHFDSIPGSPGAADDGVGVACMLEVGALIYMHIYIYLSLSLYIYTSIYECMYVYIYICLLL